MNDVVLLEDVLKNNIGEYAKGEFLLRLFTVAEELGFVTSEVELENKLALRLFNYVGRKVRFKDQIYIGIRNVMYIMELYLTSYEFKNTGLTWYDVVKIIDEDKRGISNIVHRSEEYLKKRISRVRVKLENAKRKALTMPETVEYMKILKDIDQANAEYVFYIDSKELLYKNSIILDIATVPPMFITENLGHTIVEKMANHILKELDILELFEADDISRLISNYLIQTGQRSFRGNLFELVITNYLFSNVTNENPKELVIDKVDAKIIFQEIVKNRLTAKEILTDGINKLNVPKCKAEYIDKMEEIIAHKIESIKKRVILKDEFIVTIKRE